MGPRYESQINQLRAGLRGVSATDLHTEVRRLIESIDVPALVADNTSHYIAANSAARDLTGYSVPELQRLTIPDVVTPVATSHDSESLWEDFIAHGGRSGDYEVRARGGKAIRVQYRGYASVAPGVHVLVFLPIDVASGV